MKILVMGTGAVGGYYGAVLSRSGQDVTFVARGYHLAAIKRDGLRIESVNSGHFTLRPQATERPDGTWTADLVLFCVKGYDNEAGIEIVRPTVGEGTAVLTLQNGIGSGDQLAEAFGRDKVVLGASYIDALRKTPGVIAELGGPANIVFGEEDGRRSDRAVEIYEAFIAAGVNVELSSNVVNALWKKLIFICGLSGMMSITRGTLGEVLATPETLDLTRRLLHEAVAVARAKAIDVDEDEVESIIARFRATHPDTISSMKFDLESGRPLEVAVLNGAVARMGEEVGISTPVNEFITSCLTVAHNKAVAARG